MFSTPNYISVGDEYDKKQPAHSDRARGAQMKTSPGKKGSGPDTLFDRRMKTLTEGDKYIDPGTVEKRERLEHSKKKLTGEGFKYSGGGSRSSGLGGDWGCFTRWKHETDFVVVKKGELPTKAAAQPRNIVTNPAKRGTFGTPGTTLGKGDETKYISDPYEGERRRELQDAKSASKKFVGGPFRAACRRTEYFDGQGNVAASKVYSLDRPLPARKPEKPKSAPVVTVPFKPSNPSRKGFNATLGKAPEYREDPYEAKERAEREARQTHKPAVTWKPVSGGKSLPTRSIAFNTTVPV
eukprot:NODE_2676_length_1012_cov_327.668927_g2656_i0.p1 GENE.NODE_2676_length_1012_cov_327.668927_g2656_i0~~NODE_2676_length_1012_cov_327.668927_g2656_i0.p1  ORF type:complete len:296 (+),score=61.50 NODE_2676_length_1012_cov_327.668927_g2656_i0:77-964(+)